MEAKLLDQLLALTPRIRACSGSGIFAGISAVVEELAAQLPREVPADAAACTAAADGAQPVLLALQARTRLGEGGWLEQGHGCGSAPKAFGAQAHTRQTGCRARC